MRKLLLITLCFLTMKAFAMDLNFGYLGYINPKTNRYDSIRYISHVDGNKVNTQNSVEAYEKIKLEISDGKILDNDTVTVYLNDKCLLDKYHVTKEKQVLNIPIKQDKVYVLVIIYNNMGNIKPNSTTLKIFDDNSNELAMLKSHYAEKSSILIRPIRLLTNIGGRDVVLKDKFISKTQKIAIYIKDWGRIDGDSIRLFLNKICILDDFMLQRKKYRIEIELSTNRPNQLTIYSINEGSISPNTLWISIECENINYSNSYSLMSNQEMCGSLLIFYKNTKEFQEDKNIEYSRPPPVNKRIVGFIRQKVS